MPAGPEFVLCACGCGGRILRVLCGRERRFINGHNAPKSIYPRLPMTIAERRNGERWQEVKP